MAVVGHGDQAHIPAGGLVQDHVPDLGLGDDVQHGADFVADQIVRAAHQGPGHAEPLELAAGELPGEPVQPGPLDAEGVENVLPEDAGLLQHPAKPPAGIDGLFRVLKDQLHRADAGQGQGRAVQQDLTLGGGEVPGQQPGQGGFAVAAGGEQGQPLPALHGEIAVLQHPGLLPAVAEGYVFCFKRHGSTSLLRPGPRGRAGSRPGTGRWHRGTGARRGSPGAGFRRRAGSRRWA